MGTKQTKITQKSIKKECRDLVLLCRRGDLKSTTRLVLLTLWSYTDSHGWCWPSQVSLARDTSLTERSISKAMKELRAHGIVREFKSKEFKKVLAGCSTLCERVSGEKSSVRLPEAGTLYHVWSVGTQRSKLEVAALRERQLTPEDLLASRFWVTDRKGNNQTIFNSLSELREAIKDGKVQQDYKFKLMMHDANESTEFTSEELTVGNQVELMGNLAA